MPFQRSSSQVPPTAADYRPPTADRRENTRHDELRASLRGPNMLTVEPDCSSHTPHNARTYAHHTAPTLAPHHTLGAHTHTHDTPAPYNDATQELTSTHSHTHTSTTPHSHTALAPHASPHLHTHLHPHLGAMHTHAPPDTSIAPTHFHTTPTHTFTECHRVHEWAIAGNTFRPPVPLGPKATWDWGGGLFLPLRGKR